jgi:hypothetical protein
MHGCVSSAGLLREVVICVASTHSLSLSHPFPLRAAYLSCLDEVYMLGGMMGAEAAGAGAAERGMEAEAAGVGAAEGGMEAEGAGAGAAESYKAVRSSAFLDSFGGFITVFAELGGPDFLGLADSGPWRNCPICVRSPRGERAQYP